MPDFTTQTDNYKFDVERQFNPDLYDDSTLKTLFTKYNAALVTLATPLKSNPETDEEFAGVEELNKQKKEAVKQIEQFINAHYQLFLACQEKEQALKALQEAKAPFSARLAEFDKKRKKSVFAYVRDDLPGIFLLTATLAIPVVGLSTLGLPLVLIAASFSITPLALVGISALVLTGLVLSATLLLDVCLAYHAKKQAETNHQETKPVVDNYEKQEKMLQAEIKQFSMDTLEKVEMTGTAVQATQDVPEVVGMKNTRDAFFQVNPSATATVTMTPKFVSAPGQ